MDVTQRFARPLMVQHQSGQAEAEATTTGQPMRPPPTTSASTPPEPLLPLCSVSDIKQLEMWAQSVEVENARLREECTVEAEYYQPQESRCLLPALRQQAPSPLGLGCIYRRSKWVRGKEPPSRGRRKEPVKRWRGRSQKRGRQRGEKGGGGSIERKRQAVMQLRYIVCAQERRPLNLLLLLLLLPLLFLRIDGSSPTLTVLLAVTSCYCPTPTSLSSPFAHTPGHRWVAQAWLWKAMPIHHPRLPPSFTLCLFPCALTGTLTSLTSSSSNISRRQRGPSPKLSASHR